MSKLSDYGGRKVQTDGIERRVLMEGGVWSDLVDHLDELQGCRCAASH